MANKPAIAFCFIIIAFCCGGNAGAQVLKPGFDADEYIGVLQRCAMQVGSFFHSGIPLETSYTRVYRSPEQGLHNRYDIWLSKDKSTIAINLRGTTSDLDSWVENFYSAMIPAIGSLKLTDSFTFNYKFASDPKAMVHVGWTIGIGSLAPDIIDKIRRYYREGVKQIIVEGHSQGGVLSFLLSSYLHYMISDGKLPGDLVIKTYCSGAPKPGNLYYAYDFDYINRGGWAYAVVNAADWVPETPFTVQTLNDINNINPFTRINEVLREQKKLFLRLYLSHVYRQLNHSTRKAQRKFEKYLGHGVYKQVKKYMPEYEQPKYTGSTNYTHAGNPVILEPDAAYYKQFPDTSANIFTHHLFAPYYYLVNKAYK